MPWHESCAMEERMSFVVDWQREEWSFALLCRRYGVSRKTGYKWIGRFEAGGLSGPSASGTWRRLRRRRTRPCRSSSPPIVLGAGHTACGCRIESQARNFFGPQFGCAIRTEINALAVTASISFGCNSAAWLRSLSPSSPPASNRPIHL